jgi:serine phosphatase RsbU (regulator of sigma subunit)
VTEDLDDLRAQLARQRDVIQQLEDDRQRLSELLVGMPQLFATHEPEALVIAFAEAARSLADATFALFVPADTEQAPTLVGLRWAEFTEAPAPGLAPLLTMPADGQARSIDDVTRWAASDAAALLYGVLADGRLVRSWLIAPVRGRERELRGVLYLGHPRPHAFDVQHEGQLGLLGSSLGIALDAAVLTAERERVLTALETSLLPPLLPDIPGLDLAARYRPADEAVLVGGDFYDVFRSGADRWSMVIGDVCGAGPEAAAVTGVARYTVRALAGELAPSAALERLNATLLAQDLDARFVTAVLADIGIEPGGATTLTLANGGHPPPILLRDDGSVVSLDEPHGLLLGMLPSVDAVDVPIALAPGDALVLYTDGVVEARDKEEDQFGFERLVALVGTCAGRTAAGIARRIELAVVDHAAGTVDDVAILVVRRTPRSSV